MNILLHMYPGDAWAFLIANVLVQVTVVILAARLLARLGSRWNAAWRHSHLFGCARLRAGQSGAVVGDADDRRCDLVTLAGRSRTRPLRRCRNRRQFQ